MSSSAGGSDSVDSSASWNNAATDGVLGGVDAVSDHLTSADETHATASTPVQTARTGRGDGSSELDAQHPHVNHSHPGRHAQSSRRTDSEQHARSYQLCCDAHYLGAPCQCHILLGPWEMAERYAARRRESASSACCLPPPSELGLYYVRDGKRLGAPIAMRIGE
jgi:hypothetical protein